MACVTCVWKKIEEYTMEDNVVAWLRGEKGEEPATALHQVRRLHLATPKSWYAALQGRTGPFVVRQQIIDSTHLFGKFTGQNLAQYL